MKQAEGIILKRIGRREADLVFGIYTKELGLQFFQAKGVRKQEAKLKFGLNTLNHVVVYFVPSRHHPIITDVKIKNDFTLLRNNLVNLKAAQSVANVILKITEPGLSDNRVWDLISEYMSFLENDKFGDESIVSRASYAVYYQLLSLSGFEPELVKCTQCGKAIFWGRLNVSLIDGGLVHPECSPYGGEVLNIGRKVVYLASDLKKTNILLALRNHPDSSSWSDFAGLVRMFFQYHFGMDLSVLV